MEFCEMLAFHPLPFFKEFENHTTMAYTCQY